jgi:phage baseplate assembly protein gpV
MKKFSLLLTLAIIAFCLGCKRTDFTNPAQSITTPTEGSTSSLSAGANQFLGVTCGFQYSSQLTGPLNTAQQNVSLYNPDPSNPNLTWDGWVEQLAQAGVDFVCPNLTGSQPNTNGTPTKIAPMITAINARGLTNTLKLAAFDDNAASWCAQWNQANGRGYGYAQKFDMADHANWKYIYDYNYKIFFQTVPDANRFKINGRPVIIIWTGNTNTFVTNMQGNASLALTYVRQSCQTDFGFNPYIILSGDFFTNDTTCGNPGIADGKENWFTPPNNSFTLTSFNSASTGVAVAQFQQPGSGAYLDPNHGTLFDNGLVGTVESGALLTLCEGFTDSEENAAMYRVRNLDANGTALTYAQTGYDYPNQRLNILRKHSHNPFPATLKLEAEGCDYFGGAAGGNGKTNYYRNGNIAIAPTDDPNGGSFHIGWIANNEWMEWESLPFNGTSSIQIRIANPNANMHAHLEIDGVAQATKTLPNTGSWSTWTTFDMGSVGSFTNSYHKVRIVFETGNVNFNWLQVTNGTASGVTFYQNANYGGTASQVLPVGTYTLSQLAAKGVPNDWASSVRVPAGRTLIMYSDDNFMGTSWTRTSDTPDFSTLSPTADNVVSSVKVQ